MSTSIHKIEPTSENADLALTPGPSVCADKKYRKSEQVKAAVHKRMENGTIGVAVKHVLGYRYNDERGCYIIIPEEAETVREIYNLFLNGSSLKQICIALKENGHTTTTGKEFTQTGLGVILRNEIYIGDICRQKTVSVGVDTRKQIKNRGLLPKYYYTGCHEPIIDRDTWDRTQIEYKRRVDAFPKRKCFTGMITCGACGSPYTYRQNYSKAYEYKVWYCRSKATPGTTCYSDVIPDSLLREVCAKALGVEEFDEDQCKSLIQHITITLTGDIGIDLVNGEHFYWENHHITSHFVPTTVTDAFNWVVYCALCGRRYRRVVNSGRWVYWYCSGKKSQRIRCTNHSIFKDFELRQITASAMGTYAFHEQAFLDAMDRIEVGEDKTLTFFFKDGSTKILHR